MFTHTLPLPPPGAGVKPAAGEGVAFGLKKLLNGFEELADGEGDGMLAAVDLVFLCFGAGVTEGAVVVLVAAVDGVVAGAGDGAVLRDERLGVAEAAGELLAAAVAAGEGEAFVLASDFLRE